MRHDTIYFTSPAQNWLQRLPLGNGHIGCMLGSDPVCDVIGLNDDTLWSGYHQDYHKPDFQENLNEVRRLLLENKREEAEEIVESRLTNRFTQAYLPLGDLIIRRGKGEIRDYQRSLDLSRGILFSRYINNGAVVSTQSFVSHPDDAFVHEIVCENEDQVEIRFDCKLKYEVFYDSTGFTARGIAPSDLIIGDVGNFYSAENNMVYGEPERGMRFAARLELTTDGEVIARGDGITIFGARSVALFMSSATSFAKGEQYCAACENAAKAAALRGVEPCRKSHEHDHAALYDRVTLSLCESDDDAACEERLRRMRRGEATKSDLSLLFQYGRYLLIASSRPGTQAANLQGIWNKDLIPPWWSGYTLNINLQMNYWLADRANLGECFEPLSSYTKRLCEAGKRTAREDYGVAGSVAHHQSDIWLHTTPVGLDRERIPMSARWMMWNMALPWLSLQLYDHYRFDQDERFLRETLFPIMQAAGDFIKGTFTRIGGSYCNVPSTSPENMYLEEAGAARAVCTMSAMDIGITKEFALAFATVYDVLGKVDCAAQWRHFSDEVLEYSVMENGELREWDGDFAQMEAGHRHFSMLFGVYPGESLLGSGLEGAARKALSQRLDHGSGQTGWSAVWAAILLARFGEGDAAYAVLQRLLRENIHDNLFGAHPPELFQIDANFGLTTAVCELLIQETRGVIRLLPALPRALATGAIEGVRVHGGHTFSFGWKAGVLDWLEILPARDETVTIVAPGLGHRLPGALGKGENSVSLRAGELQRFENEAVKNLH